jgi:hypothetical protein
MMFTSAARKAAADISSATFPPEEGSGAGIGAGTGATTGTGTGAVETGGGATFFGAGAVCSSVAVALSVFGARLGSVMGGRIRPGSMESVEEATGVP